MAVQGWPGLIGCQHSTGAVLGEFQVWRDGGRKWAVLDFEIDLPDPPGEVFVAIVSVGSSEWPRRFEFLKRRYPPPAASRVLKVVERRAPRVNAELGICSVTNFQLTGIWLARELGIRPDSNAIDRA